MSVCLSRFPCECRHTAWPVIITAQQWEEMPLLAHATVQQWPQITLVQEWSKAPQWPRLTLLQQWPAWHGVNNAWRTNMLRGHCWALGRSCRSGISSQLVPLKSFVHYCDPKSLLRNGVLKQIFPTAAQQLPTFTQVAYTRRKSDSQAEMDEPTPKFFAHAKVWSSNSVAGAAL
jgi:hypothetical protein